jgi:hypothetical protein
MKRKYLSSIFFCLLMAFVGFAQKPFKIGIAVNPYTLATQRYGVVAELPMHKNISLSGEFRILRKDWHTQGGEIFPTLRAAKGWNGIVGVRVYWVTLEKARFYAEPQYRYRSSEWESFDLKKRYNEGNLMTGWQHLWGKTFYSNVGMGIGYTAEKQQILSTNALLSKRNFAVIRLDIHLGVRF